MAENGNKTWLEYMRLATPVGIFVVGIFVSGIKSDVKDINTKMFSHLTNDEIHTPKSIAVSKPEFTIYQQMRGQQMDALENNIREIKDMLKK